MKERHLIHINQVDCIGCGKCMKDCPAANISIKDGKAQLVSQHCIKCGHCVAICPKAAVTMTGFDTEPQEIQKSVCLNPDHLLDAMKTRRSIRQFKEESIEDAVIDAIIEAGRLTPSGKNAQDVSYIILKEDIPRFEQVAVHLFRRILPLRKLIDPVARRTIIDDHFFFKKAPCVILIVAKDKINGSLASANMTMMAEAYGLGVLYSGFFTMAVKASLKLRNMLGLKHREHLVMTLVIGYPNVTYHRTVCKEEAFIRRL